VAAEDNLSAFVELEREALTVTFYLESIHPDCAGELTANESWRARLADWERGFLLEACSGGAKTRFLASCAEIRIVFFKSSHQMNNPRIVGISYT
jgi:hypothetical protein